MFSISSRKSVFAACVLALSLAWSAPAHGQLTCAGATGTYDGDLSGSIDYTQTPDQAINHNFTVTLHGEAATTFNQSNVNIAEIITSAFSFLTMHIAKTGIRPSLFSPTISKTAISTVSS